MMDLLGAIISAVWQLLSIPIAIDNFEFNTWQFILFIIVISVALNVLFSKKETKE